MMKHYIDIIRKFRRALVLAPLLVMLDVGCEIVQPELMSRIVDRGVRQMDLHYIISIGLFMVFLSLLAIAANVGNIYYSSHAAVGFTAELRESLFRKIQQFSLSNLDKFRSASLVTRITNDVNILQQVIMMLLRQLIRAPLMLLFAVVIAIRINAELASIIGIAIPMLSVCIYYLLRRGMPFFEKMQIRLDRLNTVIEEDLVGVRVVKSFVREGFEIKQFKRSNQDLMEMAVKASGLVVLIMPVMQMVMNLSIVAIVWYGGNKIAAGAFQVGQFMSFITYITQVLMSLMMLSITVMNFSRAGASSRRILEVLDTGSGIVDAAGAGEKGLVVREGKVEFRDVFFKYHPRATDYVLKHISFTADAGETVAIIGATGSAKSTIVQLIPRLYDVTQGQVLVDGYDVRDYTLKGLRTGIGMAPQQSQLFSGTIRQNLLWGKSDATEEEIVVAAKIAQAHDFIMSFPLQYDTVLGQGGVNLSGGQKQRICIARAIIRKPRILILDDSLSAVDTATDARIRAALKGGLDQATIFIIAHRISSVQSADRIIVLDNGGIAGMGDHETLMRTNALYREIVRSQQLTEAP